MFYRKWNRIWQFRPKITIKNVLINQFEIKLLLLEVLWPEYHNPIITRLKTAERVWETIASNKLKLKELIQFKMFKNCSSGLSRPNTYDSSRSGIHGELPRCSEEQQDPNAASNSGFRFTQTGKRHVYLNFRLCLRLLLLPRLLQ